MQKIFIPIIIFIIVLIALIFGEGVFDYFFSFIKEWISVFFYFWKNFYRDALLFIQENPYKILLAIIITIFASIWVLKNHSDNIEQPTSKRKIAIILAIFLGWLGAHRFYLNQFGLGILYIIISIIFTPLTVFVSLIDAIRYIFSSDTEFMAKYRL